GIADAHTVRGRSAEGVRGIVRKARHHATGTGSWCEAAARGITEHEGAGERRAAISSRGGPGNRGRGVLSATSYRCVAFTEVPSSDAEMVVVRWRHSPVTMPSSSETICPGNTSNSKVEDAS